MTEDISNPVLLDREHLSEISMGDEDFEKEIIGDFLASLPELLDLMVQGTAAKDAESVAQAAHSLKGSCRSLGADRVAGVCQDLEHLARGGSLDGAEALLESLNKHIADLTEFMRGAWGV